MFTVKAWPFNKSCEIPLQCRNRCKKRYFQLNTLQLESRLPDCDNDFKVFRPNSLDHAHLLHKTHKCGHLGSSLIRYPGFTNINLNTIWSQVYHIPCANQLARSLGSTLFEPSLQRLPLFAALVTVKLCWVAKIVNRHDHICMNTTTKHFLRGFLPQKHWWVSLVAKPITKQKESWKRGTEDRTDANQQQTPPFP